MKGLAIIPARSGSKGLKDKNIKLLNGKPLLAYSIEAASASGLFSEVFVSTDSQKYAEISKQYGANLPFLRSSVTATDMASSWDAVKEALKKYNEIGKAFDMVTLLQPTSPLRTAEDICNAYNIFKKKNANSVVSVSQTDHSPLWCNKLSNDHSLSNFFNHDILNKPRQKLEPYYCVNGAIYMVNTNFLIQCDDIYQSGSYAYIMRRENSIDIDDALDFLIAETIMMNREI